MITTAKPRRLTVALIASVGVNLLLVGVIVGGMGFRPLLGPGGPGDPGGPDGMIERLADRLNPKDARIVREAVRAHRAEFAKNDPERRGFPDRIRAALTADPFDPEVLRRVLDDADVHDVEFRANLRRTAVRVATEIDAESRKIIAETRPGDPSSRPDGPPPRPDRNR